MLEKQFWVYILLCKNGAFYTGMTTDLDRRYQEHVAGTIKCKYTRANPPEKIAQCWRLTGTRAQALKVEHIIKRLHRRQKEKLVQSPELLPTFFPSEFNCQLEFE